MQLALRRKLRRLPKSFPIGTTYVVEGHVVAGQGDEAGGQLQVFSRSVVLPSGQRINLGTNIGTNLAGAAVPRAAVPAAEAREPPGARRNAGWPARKK